MEMHLYEVKLIHRHHDWDAALRYSAPDAKTARKWSAHKMLHPKDWLLVSAKRVKG